MTWWMVLLIIAAVFAAIGLIPVGVDLRYHEDVLRLDLKVGPIPMTILPKDKTKKKKKKKEKKEKPKPTPEEKAAKRKKLLPNGIWSVLDYVKLLGDVLGDLGRKLRVEVLTIHAAFGGDPAKAAMTYGRAWAAVGAMTPILDRLFVIKKRDIRPILDYNGPKQALDAQLVLTITIGRTLALLLRAGLGFLKIMKGGAKHEPSSVRNDDLLHEQDPGDDRRQHRDR